MTTKKPWTDPEIELAKRLLDAAKVSRTLKPRRVLAVSASRSGGPTRTTWGAEVTLRDYLPEARTMLENGNVPPTTK